MPLVRSSFVRAVSALALTAAMADAKDLCLRDTVSQQNLVVLRGFKVPGAGKCRPVVGTTGNGSGGAHGTVCRSSEGTVLRFGFTVHKPAGVFSPPKARNFDAYVHYPALDDGGANEISADYDPAGVTATSYLNVIREYCTAPAIP